MKKPEPEYPDPICMMCEKHCERSEEVDVGGGIVEVWCYCRKCDVETFHPIPINYETQPTPGGGT